jgi:hypothetical protein
MSIAFAGIDSYEIFASVRPRKSRKSKAIGITSTNGLARRTRALTTARGDDCQSS